MSGTGSIGNLGVVDADVAGGGSVGILAGYSAGTITASYAAVAVSGTSNIGGLVGGTGSRSMITGSYATGAVSGTGDSPANVGGLAGDTTAGTSAITASFFDSDTSGQTHADRGKTTAELQTPTDATGPYASDWSTILWDFGTGSQYPALKVDFDGDGAVDDWTEFGYQLRETLGLTATGSETRVELDWNTVSRNYWSPRPAITYVAFRGDTEIYRGAGTSHNDTEAPAGVIHQYRVEALAGGVAGRKAPAWARTTTPTTTTSST